MLTLGKLRGNVRMFKACTGMPLQQFDILLANVEKAYPDGETKRLSRKSRKRGIGAGRRHSLDMPKRVLALLVHYRTYATQDVLAALFKVGQATISRSIDQVAPTVRQSAPIPAKICAESRKTSGMDELEGMFPGLPCLTDASEQQIQRPKRKDMEKVPLFGQGPRTHLQGAVHDNVGRVDSPQRQALPGIQA